MCVSVVSLFNCKLRFCFHVQKPVRRNKSTQQHRAQQQQQNCIVHGVCVWMQIWSVSAGQKKEKSNITKILWWSQAQSDERWWMVPLIAFITIQSIFVCAQCMCFFFSNFGKFQFKSKWSAFRKRNIFMPYVCILRMRSPRLDELEPSQKATTEKC